MQRKAALHRLNVAHAQRSSTLAEHEETYRESIEQLAAHCRKRRWLDALIYKADTTDATAGASSGNAAGDEESAVKTEPGAAIPSALPPDATDAQVEATMLAFVDQHAEPGRPVRTVDDICSTLLQSQLHASRHALAPGMLRTPCFPPLLPTDEPPVPDAAQRSFQGPWTPAAVRSYVADNSRKKRGA